jgi:two-component system, OmpR family, sensor histidine kinase KdpD
VARGTLRIYLGAAPGVGKTWAMLDEGHRRVARGTHVVLAALDGEERCQTIARAEGLDRVAPLALPGGDVVDVDAVRQRRPAVALIDDLGRTNPPGADHAHRWQDVDALLDAGIDVVTTLDIGQLASMADVVAGITGAPGTDHVPDAFVRRAEQVELVDISPDALRRRLAHGNVFSADRVDAAMAHAFRRSNLAALRELSLRWMADRAEAEIGEHDEGGTTPPASSRERVVVALTGAPGGEQLIRRAARLAADHHGTLVGVHVTDGDQPQDDHALERQRSLLTEVGATYREVMGDDVAAALAGFVGAERASQLVLGASPRGRWDTLRGGSMVTRLGAHGVTADLHVVPTSAGTSTLPLPRLVRRSALPRSRERIGWLLTLIGVPLLCWALVAVSAHVNLSTVLLANLALVIVIATIGGLRPGLLASVLAVGLTNWFLTPPVHTLHINDSDDIVALIVFVAMTVVVSALVDRAARRTREAGRARAEAHALARTTGAIVSAADPLPDLLDQLRALFDVRTAMVIDRTADGWALVSSAGEPGPADPTLGESRRLDADGDQLLVLVGGELTADDHAVLDAFTDQFVLGLEARRLRHEAATVDVLAQANELRTALLRAVSHDLRTPLSSIKASVSGLLEPTVAFSDTDRAALLANIDDAADRLDRVIGNLLDMSRLQAGAIQIVRRPTALEDVVAATLGHLGPASDEVVVDVSETLPLVSTDGALLERAIGNVVSNAIAWSPPGVPPRIEAAEVGRHVQLRVVDRGPGIPRELRAAVFEPFQRLGDRSNDAGAGLGLAIARGFVEATGATLELDDTPGGGSTFTFILDPAEEPGT